MVIRTTATEQSRKATHRDNILPAKCTILIVDDSAIDRSTYRRYLESANNLGCQVLDCESAESALEICRVSCPDIVLLDYLLPDANGLKFLQDLAEQLSVLPLIIMLTGQGNETVAVEAMKLGARDYLVKGQLTAQKLVNTVVNALTEHRLQTQLDRQHQQRELLTSIALKISYSIELSKVLQATVDGARMLLGCDRTVVYRLNPDLSGTIVAEAVLPEWTAALSHPVEDNCWQGDQSYQINKYLQGHKIIVTNIETANLTDCHLQMLQQFQVKAILAVPIILRGASATSESSIWGLLIAHHCQEIHEWQTDELTLINELAMQMAIAIQQAELISDLQASLAHQKLIECQLRDRVVEIETTNLRLSQATDLLEIRNQELDEFSYIASHDLQAPLRGISNLAEWLFKDLDGRLPIENQHQIELIQTRILQMNALINGLLAYARVGKENIDSIHVNLNQLLAEVVDLLVPSADWSIVITPNLPTIETPGLLLKQVFSNLISNAVKYHNCAQGKIEILVKDQKHLLQFTVIDDGPGIAPENHEKIFRIFQTLARPDDMKGTGIGLAIIKKIVESRGGSIWVESELGQGCAVSFTWPKTLG